MRAIVGIALAAATLVACAAGSAGTSQAATALTVTYWSQGIAAGDPDRWTLRCNPARGTLPRPAVACRKLAEAGTKLFAPSGGGACTQIYGGPDVARIVGTVKGNRVWANVTRTDGCQISRWDRLVPWLLPRGGVR
jgi:Subtilisin inhibitor-like